LYLRLEASDPQDYRMDIRVRRAEIEDLKHLVHHRQAMFEEMGFRDAADLARVAQASNEYFREALRLGTYVGWFAEDANAGKVVGGGGLVIAPWPGFPGENRAERVWILNMYTEPAARRQGIAKGLLKEMIEWCRKRGLRTVSLHASVFGRPLYESVGFEPTNEMRLKLR
jgi:GNAT superfamily N-acetyltransferase